jgi:hypothetical protein
MNKIKEIFKSWNIALNPDETQAELASQRIEICNSCEFKVENLGFNQCSICGCALKAKVFSPVRGACPEGKWDKIDNVMNNKIFVQIASYRDPELIPTIKDCINKAQYPERLTFGICWQHSEEDKWDNLDEFKDNPNFTIMDVSWNESKGLCWARHHIQKMWKDEYYTIQIDSHHRFAQNWDEELINMMKLTNSSKPIITSYAGMYNPSTNEKLNLDPYKMVGKKFTSGGTILFYPESIPDWEKLEKPIPARFVSGHFFFTYGIHCKEYKYDPNLYFAGDEISLSIRSYTLGYDLFHPHKTIIWHEYTREGRVKHWDDFQEKNQKKIEKTFGELDFVSKKRLRQMLQEEENGTDIGEYGLGTVRTHKDYENYAGIDFLNRILHPDTLKGIDPPTVSPDNNEWRKLRLESYSFNLDWNAYLDKLNTPLLSEEDLNFLYLGIEDGNGQVIYRQDFNDFKYINGDIINHQINIESYTSPFLAVLWINSKTKGWLNKIDIPLSYLL